MQSSAAAGTSHAPTQIGPYKVLGPIAKGGMATVYAVHRSGVGRFEKLLALKLMHPHLAEDERFVEMFLDEIRLGAFIEHTNVVRVLDVGEHEGLPFMVMEYLHGQPLSKVARHGHVPRPVAWAILLQAAQGLAAAHKTTDLAGTPLGIVHRDVSPQNIHVGYDGRVRIVDFGIAAGLGRVTTTTTGEVKGKVSYMSPEQIRRDVELDARVDVWALGVVAWELLSGQRLFRRDDAASTMYQVLSGPIPRLPADTPPALAKVINACLERNPGFRLKGATELARAIVEEWPTMATQDHISEFMASAFETQREQEESDVSRAIALLNTSDEAHTAPKPTEPAPPAEPSTRRRWTAFVIASALALVAGMGISLQSTDDERDSDSALIESRPVAIPPDEGRFPTPVPTEPTEPEQVQLEVEVDESIAYVIVDGVRHDERPLRVSAVDSGEVVLTVVGADGRREERRIDPATPPAELAPFPRRRTPRRTPRMTTMREAPDGLLPPPPGL